MGEDTGPNPFSTFSTPLFMGAQTLDKPGNRAALLGVPLDYTTTYRPGTRFGPSAIRENSIGVETYSPRLDLSLDDFLFADAGEVFCPPGNTALGMERIESSVGEILKKNLKVLSIGGEHLASLPCVKAHLNHHKIPMAVVHFDAHADLRENYEGLPHSHATVMRHIYQLEGVEKIYQIGIRSFSRDEKIFRDKTPDIQPVSSPEELNFLLNKETLPLYLTLDLDVLDPSVFPGTGTPEPGGMGFSELLDFLYILRGRNLAGMDVMELSPPWDPTGVSTVVAVKLVRELLLMLLEEKNHA